MKNPANKPLSLGVLVSGGGTNLQAILDAVDKRELNAAVKVVISDNPQAYALERAKKCGVPVRVVVRKNFPDKKSFEEEILKHLREQGVEWVALAGFMRLLSPHFLQAYPHRVLNIHPAILPSFPGMEGVKQAYDYGVKVTGCTVHLVDEGCDTGPIIAQRIVKIEDDDTLESLLEKVHGEEHRLYPQVLQWIAEGRLTIKGRKVLIKF
ncbi:MAG: phosphoribosylglycinamide formyltransferase [bacterium]